VAQPDRRAGKQGIGDTGESHTGAQRAQRWQHYGLLMWNGLQFVLNILRTPLNFRRRA